ncbi:MAG: transporter substrate-binding domain-containing protein [Nitriliruptorales bacterium]|nr:transporter substrate-binding domain-containing protein [Nitriliruptorales bacterium]
MLVLLLAVMIVGAACTADDDTAADDTDAALPADTDTETDEDAEGDTPAAEGEILSAVQDRGTLNCGVNDAVPGFGFTDEEGEFSGFDIDHCRAIAAAVLGDAEAVEFRPLTAEQRFTALQAGEVDVLVRNTTWTATRDGAEGATFLHTTFYDGQGMMVRADSEFQTLEDMGDTAICVLSGTTTELNLSSEFTRLDLNYEPVPFEDNETLQQAFEAERCDGWTSDKSQLAGVRSTFPEGPDALVILDETISKEPLGPAVLQGDPEWAQAVDWAVIATIQAEEFGITSENTADFEGSDNPDIASFLGEEDPEEGTVLDPGLPGLEPGFARDVVEQVGNYGEIYDRNLGPDTDIGLERGLNALWTDGGLLYAPPYR